MEALYALVPATITFREHGISIKGNIYYWNDRVKKMYPLHEKKVEDLRKLVRNDVMLKTDLTYLGSTYSVLGTLTSLASRKKISIVLYLHYKFNGHNMLNLIFSFLRERLELKNRKDIPSQLFILNIKEIVQIKELKEDKQNGRNDQGSRRKYGKSASNLYRKTPYQSQEDSREKTNSRGKTYRAVKETQRKIPPKT